MNRNQMQRHLVAAEPGGREVAMPANATTQEGMLWAEEVTSGDGVCVVYQLPLSEKLSGLAQDYKVQASAPLLLQVIPERPWEASGMGDGY